MDPIGGDRRGEQVKLLCPFGDFLFNSLRVNAIRFGDISMKTGVAPQSTDGVNCRCNGVRDRYYFITPVNPKCSQRQKRASEPEFTPTACRTPMYFENAFSKSATSSPKTNHPLSMTLEIALSISG